MARAEEGERGDREEDDARRERAPRDERATVREAVQERDRGDLRDLREHRDRGEEADLEVGRSQREREAREDDAAREAVHRPGEDALLDHRALARALPRLRVRAQPAAAVPALWGFWVRAQVYPI